MKTFDLIIIGGGAGAFAAAIRANELGAKTALVNSGLPLVGGVFFLGRSSEQPDQSGSFANTALAAKFEKLSQSGNSSLTRFTGEQITELWNLSDGCGGDNEHTH